MVAMSRRDGPQAPSDLRTALRLRTAGAHRRLDRLPMQRALLQPGLTLPEYGRILACHARAHARCEAQLDQVAAACPDDLAPYRPRLPALRADLARLPGDPTVATGPARTLAVPAVGAPRDDRDAEGRYLGLRYVLDGATQGARGIAPRLAEHLPELLAGPFAFWRLQLDEAGAWRDVTRALAARPADGRLADAAVAAAGAAFEAFLAAFAPVGRGGPVDGEGASEGEATT
jgi:heme oxygenase